MDLLISSYKNFKNIPSNVMCVGVTLETPKEFRTTEIKNYIYTPRSILSGEFPTDGSINFEEFCRLFKEHLKNKTKGKWSCLEAYFSEMIREFSNMSGGSYTSLCFLGRDEYSDTDMSNVVKKLLEEFGYTVRRFGSPSVKSNDDISLF